LELGLGLDLVSDWLLVMHTYIVFVTITKWQLKEWNDAVMLYGYSMSTKW